MVLRTDHYSDCTSHQTVPAEQSAGTFLFDLSLFDLSSTDSICCPCRCSRADLDLLIFISDVQDRVLSRVPDTGRRPSALRRQVAGHSPPVIPVEGTEVNGLTEMPGLDVLALLKVGNGSRHSQNLVVSAG